MNRPMKEDILNYFRLEQISIVVLSCDAYSDLWKPFFSCFFKYWPDCPFPISLASNQSEYPDSRVKPILIGPDLDYSSNLLVVLNQIETPWVILWLEDIMVTTTVDTARVMKIIERAQKNGVGYQKLLAQFPWFYPPQKGLEIGPIPKGVKYRSGFGLALWKKETILKLLQPGESAWQIDRSNRSNSLSEPFFGFTPDVRLNPPIQIINTVIKGKWNYNAPRFLKKEGLDSCIQNRKKISLWEILYRKLYSLRLDFYRIMSKYWYD